MKALWAGSKVSKAMSAVHTAQLQVHWPDEKLSSKDTRMPGCCPAAPRAKAGAGGLCFAAESHNARKFRAYRYRAPGEEGGTKAGPGHLGYIDHLISDVGLPPHAPMP